MATLVDLEAIQIRKVAYRKLLEISPNDKQAEEWKRRLSLLKDAENMLILEMRNNPDVLRHVFNPKLPEEV